MRPGFSAGSVRYGVLPSASVRSTCARLTRDRRAVSRLPEERRLALHEDERDRLPGGVGEPALGRERVPEHVVAGEAQRGALVQHDTARRGLPVFELDHQVGVEQLVAQAVRRHLVDGGRRLALDLARHRVEMQAEGAYGGSTKLAPGPPERAARERRAALHRPGLKLTGVAHRL